MARSVTLFTGQWADLPLEQLCQKAKQVGYDGLELACWGDHFEVEKADAAYCRKKREMLERHGLKVYAISAHLVGQAVCDRIDERHKAILSPAIWGDGDPEGVRQRAAKEMIAVAKAAKTLGVKVVNGFTGSSIWHMLYAFPPVSGAMVDAGYADFGKRWKPILDQFQKAGVKFALEVHPSEIAFDIVSAERAIAAVDGHPAFGFNFDPSHFGYQNVDYLAFVHEFGARIFNCHVKDVWWSERPTPIGTFGGHSEFGRPGRAWDFRSPGRGRIDFEGLIRALNQVGYRGPLTVEWEDPAMDREAGAREAAQFVRRLDFAPSKAAFDAAFAR